MSKYRTNLYLDESDHIDKIPYQIENRSRKYYYVREYPNYYLYEHSYGNGSYYECFDKHDINILARYGYC
jgi:hypothetical protein